MYVYCVPYVYTVFFMGYKMKRPQVCPLLPHLLYHFSSGLVGLSLIMLFVQALA